MLIEGPQAVNRKCLEGKKARLRDWSAWANNVCDLSLSAWIESLNCEGGKMGEESEEKISSSTATFANRSGLCVFETARKISLW